RTLAGYGRENVNSLGFESGGDGVVQRADTLEFHAWLRVQLVTGDSRPLGDISKRDFDAKLRQSLLHEPCIGHQLFFRFGWLEGRIRILQKIHWRQAVIAN